MTGQQIPQDAPEHEKARLWRENMGLSRPQLADLLGYSESTIADMEAGRYRKSGRLIAPETWKAYRLCCAAITAGLAFDWRSCALKAIEERTIQIPAWRD